MKLQSNAGKRSLNLLRGCLCEGRDGITSEIGQQTILEDYSHFFINLLLRLHEAEMFFFLPRSLKVHSRKPTNLLTITCSSGFFKNPTT